METRRFNVDQLLNIPLEALAVREILAGTFNEELKKVAAARDELTAKLAIADTVDAATQVKKDADTYAAKVRADAAGFADAAAKALADAQLKSDVANTGMVALSAAKTDHQVAVAAFESAKATTASAQSAKASQLAAREAAVQERERKLEADASALSRRLEALKAI